MKENLINEAQSRAVITVLKCISVTLSFSCLMVLSIIYTFMNRWDVNVKKNWNTQTQQDGWTRQLLRTETRLTLVLHLCFHFTEGNKKKDRQRTKMWLMFEWSFNRHTCPWMTQTWWKSTSRYWTYTGFSFILIWIRCYANNATEAAGEELTSATENVLSSIARQTNKQTWSLPPCLLTPTPPPRAEPTRRPSSRY